MRRASWMSSGRWVGVLEETNKVGFDSLLQSKGSRPLEAKVALEVLGDLTKGSLGLLVATDLTKGDSSGVVYTDLLTQPSINEIDYFQCKQ